MVLAHLFVLRIAIQYFCFRFSIMLKFSFAYVFLVILAGCASAPSGNSLALDQPISFRGSSEAEVIAAVIKSLPQTDAGEFQMANEIVRKKFDARAALPLTHAERAHAYEAVVQGLTPRQVILLGMMLHADRSVAVAQSQVDRRPERTPREDHIQEHDDGDDTVVIEAIRRYTPVSAR
jgi:hypothetical protein